MEYTEIKINIHIPDKTREILISKLSSLGYEGFIEEDDCLIAYIPSPNFNQQSLNDLLNPQFQIKTVPDQNWNALWESNFEPVIIANQCYVRAPFHPARPEIPMEIIIEPKMSFGTAHHETTALMMELVLSLDIKGKSLLDMGCGTAILAILASKRGAGPVLAIDNDEWAWRNALENIKVNGTEEIEVVMGDALSIPEHDFDIILANINRNILIQDIPVYARHMHPGSLLVLSGFYIKDMDKLKSVAEIHSLRLQRYLSRNDWVAGVFVTT